MGEDTNVSDSDERYLARNGAGQIIGTYCTNCHRIMDGERARLCGDCQRESRSSSRSSSDADEKKG
jgi:uncharacterized OB-fold protein